MRINTVTIEKKKFSEVDRVFRALYSSSRLFSIIFVSYSQIMYSRLKKQTGGAFFLRDRIKISRFYLLCPDKYSDIHRIQQYSTVNL